MACLPLRPTFVSPLGRILVRDLGTDDGQEVGMEGRLRRFNLSKN